MSYNIEPINIKDPIVDNQIRNLIKEAFKTEHTLPEGYIYKNTYTDKSSKESVFLAAIEDGQIIGCNGFMSTDFIYNQSKQSCYQSCWSATHPKHQGRKIFVNIINEGKRFLKEAGGGFIYGVPNNNSHPIFIKKLGFKEIPSLLIQIPNIPFLKNSYFNRQINKGDINASTFRPVESQIVDLKKKMNEESILEIYKNKSYLWGKRKIKKTKFGISLNYFYLGGMELHNQTDFYEMIEQIFDQLNVHYIQIVSCEKNRYNNLLKKWKKANMNGFIFFELNSLPVENVNLFYGAIDVF